MLEIIPEDYHGAIRFTVRDTGVGIPADQLEQIFTSYTQAESSTARKYGGTGLGLAIVKQLVELMGGRVAVESEVDHGSTFHVVAHFDLPDEPSAAAAIAEQPLSDLKILVADQSSTNRRTLAAILTRLGASAATVANGDEVLERLRNHERYNTVLLGIHADGIDSYEIAQRMVAAGFNRPAIIPLLRADDLSVKLSMFRRLGVTAYLIKPIRRAELESALEAVAEERDAARFEASSALSSDPAATRVAPTVGGAPGPEDLPRSASPPAVSPTVIGSLRILVAMIRRTIAC